MSRLIPLLIAAACWFPAAAAEPPYLPSEGWSHPGQRDFYEGWFAKHLRSMGEPVLSGPGALAGYRSRFRLLVLPSFHRPYAIRVDERANGKAEVRAVRTEGHGGYGPGKPVEQEHYAPTKAQLERLHRAIEASNLSTLPREDLNPSALCTDGVQFVFELVDESGSQLITRHQCGTSKALWDLVDAADSLRRKVGSDLPRYHH
jgi:hypothetical protein